GPRACAARGPACRRSPQGGWAGAVLGRASASSPPAPQRCWGWKLRAAVGTDVLGAIVRWSLRFPIVVCVLAGMLALYGVLVLARAKYDVFPEFVPPQAAVQTEAPGLVAGQVELLVTLPIEQAISGASGVQAVGSETISGLSG